MKKVLSLTLALTLCFTLALGVAQADELQKATLRLNYYVSGLHAPFFVALEKGYYTEAGIDLTIGEGKGSGTTTTLIGNGSDTFGISDLGTTAIAITQGMPVKVVAPIYASNAFAIIASKDSGIATPKDLEGKKVGITEGDAPSKLFTAVAAANDVDVSKVEFISMDSNAKTGALMTGRVDAVLGGADAQAIQLKKEGYDATVIRYSEVGVNTVGLSIVAGNSTIESNPTLITSFIAATFRGWEDAQSDPAAAVAILQKYYPTVDATQGLEELTVALNCLYTADSTEMGRLPESDWTKTFDLLTNYMGLEAGFQPTDFYSDALLPETLPAKP